ncbi:hypothetical protein U1872_09120 [Sphingomonas sp. RB3P16]|uniref:hypothetical protein n=1 Tax=Parasphingomonas frigoris TaxID=3096163 RepID=UPI002FCC5220
MNASANSGAPGLAATATVTDDMQWRVVGDSHADAIRFAAEAGMLARACQVTVVAGATAVGLRNPNSKTDAIAIFRETLLPLRRAVIPVIQLGEVDCGFVIWYRATKNAEPVEDQLEAAVAGYFSFVDELLDKGYPTVVVTGAVPPTIRDGQAWGDVANARREVTASLLERTRLTQRYNERLRQEATSRGLCYVDLLDSVLNAQTGVLDDKWRHPDPTDHHLDPAQVSILWADRLNRLRF